MSSSTKPYMLRALHQWCGDNGYTPYIVVWVNSRTDVPLEYVKNNEIVLNIAETATKNLRIDNEWVSFSARFGGVSRDIWVPIGNVMSIFARETGEGMGFEVEPMSEEAAALRPVDAEQAPESGGGDPSPGRPSGRPSLRIVK
ncbi:ClpXP protease specificity-enhancing factor [Chromobacterium violaceum]|uniref:ClpXP protease specificity-enhancing factor n=1 Tax=Chromobacterium violaceum TaxID=536 RepID=UPI0009DA0960|nr:ClpXP protease specificity-enhancing factor [Chromobacterium violaceum]MBP4050874.1 ClpXP protease specificity-enhancing factor [Chromobacterium violaceum]OQS21161.1 ClpXP protease specificity-enhancing factor [Chromobacterium violaceum]